MLSDRVYDLCHGQETVSSVLAKDPSVAPGDIYKKLYSEHENKVEQFTGKRTRTGEYSEEILKRASECGNWGPTKPGELFLKVRDR